MDETRRPRRNPRWLLLAVGVLLLTACGTGGAASSPASAHTNGDARRAAAQLEIESLPRQGASDEIWGRTLDPPLPAPDLQLTSTDGTTFDFARDADAPVTLVYFGYTSCPDVCPMHMAAVGRALDRLPPPQKRAVDVLFVSVDPTTDTPERLEEYLANFGPTITGLTGTPEEINDALASVALPRSAIGADAEGPPEHPSYVLGYTADDRAHVAWPFGTTPDTYLHDLRMLIDRG